MLDAHVVSSEFIGYNDYGHPMFDSQRTELGQALYQLKYGSDRSRIVPIAETVAKFVASWESNIELIVPMPASTAARKTVAEICAKIASEMRVDFCEDCLSRPLASRQVKNLGSLAERRAEVAGRFVVLASRTAGRRVLLIDDLYQTGTTIAAASETLRVGGRAAAVFALALTYARSIVI